MKPYFETELGRLYHGDCLEIIPHLEPVDLVLTDPPYGVNHHKKGAHNRYKIVETIYGDKSIIDLDFSHGKKMIIWGGNNFCKKLPISTGWLVWYKYHPDTSQHSQAELAWTNIVKTIRHYSEAYHGFMRKRDGWFHPTQKPVGLMKWCIGFMPNGIICDPFIGSGTTAIACEQLNRRWIGIEISEKYCEIAAKRIEKELQQLKMFPREIETKKPTQIDLIK